MRWSDNGSFLSSSSMSVLMMFLAVRADTSSPSSVSRPLREEELSSNTPRGVCTYLPLHARLTVDSCMSI